MGKSKTKNSVEITEIDGWGEGFGLIMIPEPRCCPRCEGFNFWRLVYGYPAEDLSEDEKEYYRLGGCIVREEAWHCEDCSHEW